MSFSEPFIKVSDKKKESETTTTPVTEKRRTKAHESSDEENSSEDDDVYKNPSPSKQPVKPKELLDMISVSKPIVKYVKLTSINYEIVQNNGVALQQSNITRWILLSSLLISVQASLEHIRLEKQKLNLNRISVEILRDLVILLETFKDVVVLIQCGDHPTLHMVSVGLNKVKLYLSGEDVDSNGDRVTIDG